MEEQQKDDPTVLSPRRRGRPLTAAKRNAILAGAREAFTATPFDQVLVDHVAHRAGVGKGTLYRYFSSKEDLYVGMVVAGLGELRDHLEAAVRVETALEAKLRAFARGVLTHFWTRTRFHALINREEGQHEKSHPLWEKERDALRAQLIRILEDGAAAGRIRRMDFTRAAIDFFGLVRAGNLNRRPGETPERLAEEVVDFYLTGLGGK